MIGFNQSSQNQQQKQFVVQQLQTQEPLQLATNFQQTKPQTQQLISQNMYSACPQQPQKYNQPVQQINILYQQQPQSFQQQRCNITSYLQQPQYYYKNSQLVQVLHSRQQVYNIITQQQPVNHTPNTTIRLTQAQPLNNNINYNNR